MNIKLCSECGEEMSRDYVKNQAECFGCGHVVGKDIHGLEIHGKYDEAWVTYPNRYWAVIYRVQPLWMGIVEPDAIEFQFAADVPGLTSKKQGYKYRLISIYAAKGFPWPTDFARSSRKDVRATNIPTHIVQLRHSIATAVAKALAVEESEVRDLEAVIKSATTPEQITKRKKNAYVNNAQPSKHRID